MHPILRMAIKKSREHEHHEILGFYLAAIITRGSSVISIGYNDINSNGFVSYLSTFGSTRTYINKHAEVDAILKARAKTDLRGCKIYVARTTAAGTVGRARPCVNCQVALANYGISRAYYTISDSEYGVLHVSNKTDKLVSRDACAQ